jgi:hypothetical protein
MQVKAYRGHGGKVSHILDLMLWPLYFSMHLFTFCCIRTANIYLPDPSLSISVIIFLISSFLGSNPKALIATYKHEKNANTVEEIHIKVHITMGNCKLLSHTI